MLGDPAAKLVATSPAYPPDDGEVWDTPGIMAGTFAGGSRAALGYEDGVVRLFDTTADTFVQIAVSAVSAPSGDERAGEDWEARRLAWDARRGRLACLANRRWRQGDDHNLQAWLLLLDGDTLAPALRCPLTAGAGDEYVNAFSWAADGDVFATCDPDRSLALRRQDDGNVYARIPRPGAPPDGYRPGWRKDVALAQDGTRLAATLGLMRTDLLVTWRLDGRRPPIRLSEHQAMGRVEALAWSPDGRRLAWSDTSGGVWWVPLSDTDVAPAPAAPTELAHPVETFDFNGFDRPLFMERLAWSPDGEVLAGVDPFGALYLWEPAHGEHYTRAYVPTYSGLEWGVAWGPGRLLTPREQGTAGLWRLEWHE